MDDRAVIEEMVTRLSVEDREISRKGRTRSTAGARHRRPCTSTAPRVG